MIDLLKNRKVDTISKSKREYLVIRQRLIKLILKSVIHNSPIGKILKWKDKYITSPSEANTTIKYHIAMDNDEFELEYSDLISWMLKNRLYISPRGHIYNSPLITKRDEMGQYFVSTTSGMKLIPYEYFPKNSNSVIDAWKVALQYAISDKEVKRDTEKFKNFTDRVSRHELIRNQR